MMQLYAYCERSYYSPLDRSNVLHIKGKYYKAYRCWFPGVLAVECEDYGGYPKRINIYHRDKNYTVFGLYEGVKYTYRSD